MTALMVPTWLVFLPILILVLVLWWLAVNWFFNRVMAYIERKYIAYIERKYRP